MCVCFPASSPPARSRLLVPAVDLILWYFAVDLLAQWNAFGLPAAGKADRLEAKKLSERLASFVRRRWPFVVHHLTLLLVAWPLLVSVCVVGERGPSLLGEVCLVYLPISCL